MFPFFCFRRLAFTGEQKSFLIYHLWLKWQCNWNLDQSWNHPPKLGRYKRIYKISNITITSTHNDIHIHNNNIQKHNNQKTLSSEIPLEIVLLSRNQKKVNNNVTLNEFNNVRSKYYPVVILHSGQLTVMKCM